MFARRLIVPDSPIDDGEDIGEYMGGENITADEYQRYMFDLNPDRQKAYMISFQGVIRDGWVMRRWSVPAWRPLAKTHVMTTYTTASTWYVRKRKGKQLWMAATNGKAAANTFPDHEVLISYGESAYCKASLPTDVLLKSVRH